MTIPDNNFIKIVVSPPGDTDPPSDPIYTTDHMLAVNPPFVGVAEFVTVWTFLSDEEKADVSSRSLTIDVAPKIQAAIDYVLANAGLAPKNTLIFPVGSYRIESSLTVPGPLNIVGSGEGSPVFPFSQPPSELVWYGDPADSMLIFGTNGQEPFTGGGIQNLSFTGRSIAANCLEIVDAVRGYFRNLALCTARQKCLYIHNSEGVLYPTAFHSFVNLLVESAVTGTDTCIGIYVDGPMPDPPTVGGVACCSFDQVVGQTDQGPCIYIGNRGDNFL